MTASQPVLSVIVPAYKQQKTIDKDLLRIYEILKQLRYRSELICVVDGIVDNTYTKAMAISKKHKDIFTVGYANNKGKGYAVRYGMAKSRGQVIAFIDAGMDIDPNGLSMLLEHFEWYKADIVVGSKRHPASKVSYPWQRRILSVSYQFLTWCLFGLQVKDTQVGIKLFKRQVLEQVLPRLLVRKFAFDIEILAVANYLGFNKIYEAPVSVKLDFGKQSVLTDRNFLKTVFAMLYDTLAVFYRLRILNYYADNNKRKWRYDPDLDFRVNLP